MQCAGTKAMQCVGTKAMQGIGTKAMQCIGTKAMQCIGTKAMQCVSTKAMQCVSTKAMQCVDTQAKKKCNHTRAVASAGNNVHLISGNRSSAESLHTDEPQLSERLGGFLQVLRSCLHTSQYYLKPVPRQLTQCYSLLDTSNTPKP